MDLAPDFNEFFGLLTANRVEFVVVGAYALALHGAPRYTGDMDILVRPTHDNAGRVLTAIREFGFPTDALTPDAAFITNKRAAGRAKDLADIEALGGDDSAD